MITAYLRLIVLLNTIVTNNNIYKSIILLPNDQRFSLYLFRSVHHFV